MPMSEDLSSLRIHVTTMGDLLLTAADRNPDKLALVFPEVHYTYAQLANRSIRLARSLQALGVKRRDHVGILMHTCAEFVELYFVRKVHVYSRFLMTKEDLHEVIPHVRSRMESLDVYLRDSSVKFFLAESVVVNHESCHRDLLFTHEPWFDHGNAHVFGVVLIRHQDFTLL